MLKSGIYRHKHQKEYAEGTVDCGDILLEVHETKTAFVLKLLEQQVRYDAPQIDDLFQNSDRGVIKKDGSKHGMSFCSGQDDWFCLYPYRVGVPYAFTREGPVMSMTETKRKKEESIMSNPRQKAPAASEQQKKAEAAPDQQRTALPTEITARAYPKTGNGNILASLTFDVNGCFAVRGAKLVQGKTLIVIAHRLSTVKNADCIYVINHGSIEESGTHDELLAKGGLYSSMWTAHITAKDGEEDV